MKINGLRAIVTGGAMGIGLATVKRLLKEGCRVTVWDLNEGALKQAADELKGFADRLYFHQCDVTDLAKVKSLVETAHREMGGTDILVNNAGMVAPGMFHEVDDALHKKTFDVNVMSIIYATRAVLPGMYERNSGVIVNLSSAAGTLGVAGLSTYASSKWAVWGLTESLRHEAKNLKKRVRFVSIHPHFLAKGMFEGAGMRGLGGLIVPLVKNHDVIAKAIVNSGIKRRKTVIYRPRSVRTAVLFRGIFPDKLIFGIFRFLNVHTGMQTWKGRNHD